MPITKSPAPAATGGRGTKNALRDTQAQFTPSQKILPVLNGVRKAGTRWRADCPNGHSNAKGSLAITESDDGLLLMHWFACADTAGIMGSLDLEMGDLYPEPIKDLSPEGRRAARAAFKRKAWAAAL